MKLILIIIEIPFLIFFHYCNKFSLPTLAGFIGSSVAWMENFAFCFCHYSFFLLLFNKSRAISIKWDLFLYFFLSCSSLSIHFISSSSIVALMGFFILYAPVQQRLGMPTASRNGALWIFLYYKIYYIYLLIFYGFYNII